MTTTPLADRMRPQTLDDLIGQPHLTQTGKLLNTLVHNQQPASLIFWGPPGTGKTTLALIYANALNAHLISLSAVTSGVKDIKQSVEEAKTYQSQEIKTVLFVDEIHRFNKSQQDYLLPHVEHGLLILIGATTENPSFEINNALLSRTRVITLNSLSLENLNNIISRAAQSKEGLNLKKSNLSQDNTQLISHLANGDARTALNILELAYKLSQSESQFKEINKEHVLEAAQKESLYYDRQGDEHYNTISAFIKSMRASQTDAALYYLTRMLESGEDPMFIARRMVIFASEDIGLANNNALLLANQVFQAVHQIGMPEASITLGHGVVYLCQSPKNRDAYDALQKAWQDTKSQGNLPIPLHIRNAPTKLMKDLNYGQGYQMYDKQSYLPDEIKNHKYFHSTQKKET